MSPPNNLFRHEETSRMFAHGAPLEGESVRQQHLRFIHAKKRSGKVFHIGPNQMSRDQIPDLIGYIEDCQRQGFNVYWGPNGGPKAEDVASCRFVFFEWDPPQAIGDRMMVDPVFRQQWKSEAFNRILDVELPKAIGLGADQWRTELAAVMWSGGKSWHVYMKIGEPVHPDEWRRLQDLFSNAMGSDPRIKDPSRVMRFPGSAYLYHHKEMNQIQHIGNAEFLAITPFI
jgi:hypothetical protein